MIEGLYTGEFETPFGRGTGVLYMAGGKVHGGNSTLSYIGEYSQDGENLKLKLQVKRYVPNGAVASVFGMDNLTIFVSGVVDGEKIKIDGHAEQMPDMKMQGTLTLLS